jgi:hypothetical protein
MFLLSGYFHEDPRCFLSQMQTEQRDMKKCRRINELRIMQRIGYRVNIEPMEIESVSNFQLACFSLRRFARIDRAD